MMYKLMPAMAIAIALTLTGPALAEPVTLTVTGHGSASSAPDIGTIRAGVETDEKTAAEAVMASNALSRQIIATLKEAGVAPRDIQTGSLFVEPRYGDMSGSLPRRAPAIVSYRVVNEVSVTIRALKDLGEILDRVVQAGANRINSVGFGLSDDRDVTDEARRNAVAAGILSINEGGSFQPQQRGGVMMRAEASSVPVEAGESTVRASVTIVWEIAPNGG
jgi:uncharacterized protein YggE